MTVRESVEQTMTADSPATSGGQPMGALIAPVHGKASNGAGSNHSNGVTIPKMDGASKDAVAAEAVARGNLDHHVIPDGELLQYPWSCIGRLEATPKGSSNWQLAGTGVLVAPNMLLTASHIFSVRPIHEWNFRFYPAYKGQPQTQDPNGGTRTSAFLTGRMITGKPNGDHANNNQVVGWDFVICELTKKLGDHWGHIGVRSGGNSFYKDHRWYSVGYPQGLGGQNPIRFPGIDISDVDSDDYNTKEIETDDYNFDTFFPGDQNFSPGWSGGPLLGVVDGAWWVVGVMSGREPDGIFDFIDGVNVFAGGKRLVEAHQQANKDWFPSRAVVPTWAHVAPVSRSTDKLALFVTDVDGKIRTASWEPAFADGWRGWHEINGGRAGGGTPLHAVSRSKDKLDIFVVAQEIVFSAAWEPAFTDGWHGWWEINGGRAPGARINAVVRGKDKLDIFVAGSDGRIWTAAWDPAVSNHWRGWWPIGNVKVPHGGYIHAVSRSTDKLDIFVTDVNGKVRTAAWEPAFTDGWHGWWEINGGMAAPGAPVTAVARSKDKLDIFVVGTDGRVWTAAWDPAVSNNWRGWWPIGDIRMPAGSAVHVVSRSKDKLDIFATDVNGVIQTAWWEPSLGATWGGWREINGGRAKPGTPVTAVSRRKDHLDIFVVGLDGYVWTAAWQPSFGWDWYGWAPVSF
ncbi:MAG: hypothetical protein DYG89_36450 [Caldilinea sp. CFX5]|nr:hypothetical protein [Caldilinea sp. CFX5]